MRARIFMISSLGQDTAGFRLGGSAGAAAARVATSSSASSGANVEPRRPAWSVTSLAAAMDACPNTEPSSFETKMDSRRSNWGELPSLGGKYDGPPFVGDETKLQPGNRPGLSESCGMKMEPPRGRRLSKGLASSSSGASSSGVPLALRTDSSLVASSLVGSRWDFCSASSRSSGEKGCEFWRVRSEPVAGRVLL